MVNQQQNYRLQELGDFLRTRRARLTPEEVGLPHGGRRKTPGLRRTEVAQMVGVSVDWYTWLEQGRSIRPSTQVLERLVLTLRLDAAERNHLFFLAQQQAPPLLEGETEVVSPALRHFLDQFGSPAFVSDKRWDVLARNDAGCAVFGDDHQRTGRQRNTIWNVFTEPLSREFIVDWEADARHLLTQFRSTCARYPDDPQLAELIHDLQLSSPEFRAWWSNHEVLSGQEGWKTLNHPQAGYLQFERLTFQVFDTPDLKVTVYTPLAEYDTPRKLEQLLDQWYREKGRERSTLKEISNRIPTDSPEQDTVGLWLAACCQLAEGAWSANREIMTSYTQWCAAHSYTPKTVKSVSQALARQGFKISINKRVVDEHERQKMVRGVRGLVVLS